MRLPRFAVQKNLDEFVFVFLAVLQISHIQCARTVAWPTGPNEGMWNRARLNVRHQRFGVVKPRRLDSDNHCLGFNFNALLK